MTRKYSNLKSFFRFFFIQHITAQTKILARGFKCGYKMKFITREFLTCLVILFIIGGLKAFNPIEYRKLYNQPFS